MNLDRSRGGIHRATQACMDGQEAPWGCNTFYHFSELYECCIDDSHWTEESHNKTGGTWHPSQGLDHLKYSLYNSESNQDAVMRTSRDGGKDGANASRQDAGPKHPPCPIKLRQATAHDLKGGRDFNKTFIAKVVDKS